MGIRPEKPETFPVMLRRPWYAPNGHYYTQGYNELPVELKDKLPSTARTDDAEKPAAPVEEPKTLKEAGKDLLNNAPVTEDEVAKKKSDPILPNKKA